MNVDARDVLVVGAGPVGLTLAAELARHGARPRIVDRLLAPSPFCRAIGVTPRTLEVWDDMGTARDMIASGLWLTGLRSIVYGQPTRDMHLDLSDLPYGQLGLPQYATERLLTRHLETFGVAVERGVSLGALVQHDEHVHVTLVHADGREENADFRYVVGCDGAHSTVRKALGIAFEGDAFPMEFMLGDVHIAWSLERGVSLRALRLVENDAPDMFIAIPLPEPGRYRVSMLAPDEARTAGDDPSGNDHGIQSERAAPPLDALQAVADRLLPERAGLSDLRWSSIFRISMRLAAHYRMDRVFIAGDAAHIHPPTGGQGMNTGIQDAYNLAWKLALVLRGAARVELLDSYEAERRPVGADVVARTRAASVNFGREARHDRLADTQILVSYRGGASVRDDGRQGEAPMAGDRAPDCTGLRQQNVGFPLRLFDVLRGPEHVLLVPLAGLADDAITSLARFSSGLAPNVAEHLRIAAIIGSGAPEPPLPGIQILHDDEGQFGSGYGRGKCYLVRPDGYIGWRGASWEHPGLDVYLGQVFSR